jgi:bacterioferritin
MSNEDVINMLNADITGEIEAILTYLRHQFVCGVCEISRTMEETARDEMRHVEWLSEKVVNLGGIPTIEHAQLHLEGEGLPAMLKRDVGLEEMAINQYQDHIDTITDPKIRHLLRKIMNEEIEHRDEFADKLHGLSIETQSQGSVEKTELTIGSLKEGGE